MFVGHHAAAFIGSTSSRLSGYPVVRSHPTTRRPDNKTTRRVRTTVARDRAGTVALWALVTFLGWMAIAQWLFVPWAWWIDRHRQAIA